MRTIFFATALVAALTTGAFAQVHQRKVNQQGRIANGVKSGQLTAGETKNLENRESNLNKEIRTDRSQDGGKLTSAQKQQVNRQQNRLSNQIYADKHNDVKQRYGNNEVDQRRYDQQQRISQGIASGKLNAGQTARLENKESAINHQTWGDRSANGGNLTNNEKHQINQEQNKVSDQIYDAKHK
ncbi:MAG TPA: hypothetical protein VKU01_27115 [Bryobacteraceae bacterium]|nr:hypothetical protein [Bryobacteraceae bacterium]